jgi:hypothetical protein
MFGLGPLELLIGLLCIGVLGAGALAVVILIVNQARKPRAPRKCPHCGKELPD